MTSSKPFFTLLALPIVFLASCLAPIKGNGIVEEETRAIEEFTKLSISGSYEVFIRQGTTCELKIEADENLLPLILTENSGDWLKIRTEQPIMKAKSLKLYISVIDIDNIDISGAVKLKSKGVINGKSLDLDLSGAGEIDMDLYVNELNLDLSGGTETHLRGGAEKLNVDIAGAGQLEADELQTSICNIDISGAGEANLFVTEELDADISGAGEIRYKGHPQVNKDISGAGSIISID